MPITNEKKMAAVIAANFLKISRDNWDTLAGGIVEISVKIPAALIMILVGGESEEVFDENFENFMRDSAKSYADYIIKEEFGGNLKEVMATLHEIHKDFMFGR